jgi:hypothetical protein
MKFTQHDLLRAILQFIGICMVLLFAKFLQYGWRGEIGILCPISHRILNLKSVKNLK